MWLRPLPSFFTAFFFSADAVSAPIKDVLTACDNTPGCGYSINDKNGDISGCSKTGCFYCPNDGKRECISVARTLKPGKFKPEVVDPDVKLK